MRNAIVIILLGMSWTFLSCSCETPTKKRHKSSIPITKPVKIDEASKGVIASIKQNQQATEHVDIARSEIKHAKETAQETNELIHTMSELQYEKLPRLIELKEKFDGHIVIAESQLISTGRVLTRQLLELRKTEIELVRAKEQSIASENEKVALRQEKESLEKTVSAIDEELKKAEVYKEKYHKLTKYKWIVWGLGAWILIKFLGGLGAWSPQGRIAKALIG